MKVFQFFSFSVFRGKFIWLPLFLGFVMTYQIAIGQTYTWEGDVSSSYSTPGNWDPSGVPNEYSDIEIPNSIASGHHWPQITGTPACRNITFLSGGTVVQRMSFTSTGALSIYGNFTNNSGQVDVLGDSTVNVAYLIFKGSGDKTFTGTTLIKNMTLDKSSGTSVSVESGRPEITRRLKFISGDLYIKTTGGLKMRAKQGSTTNEAYTAFIEQGLLYGVTGPGAADNVFISQYIPPLPYNSENPDGYCFHYLGSPVYDFQFYKTVKNTINKYPTIDWYNPQYVYPSGQSPCFYNYYEPEYDPTGSESKYGWLGLVGEGSNQTLIYQCEGIGVHYAPKRATRVIDWKGAPNTGDIPQSFRYTDNGEPGVDGKNLAGNPFPSPLSWAGVYADNSGGSTLASAINIWNSDGALSNTGTLLFYDGDPEANTELNTHNGILAIGQGFVLRVTENNTNIDFNNWNRFYGNGDIAGENITPYRKAVSTNSKANNLGLVLEQDGSKAFTSIIANDKYTKGFDALWDNGKAEHPDQKINVFTQLDGIEYSINKFNLDKKGIAEVELKVEADKPGKFTLKPYCHTFTSGDYRVYLKDRERNQLVLLENTDTQYSFDMISKNSGNRFSLVFANRDESAASIMSKGLAQYTVYQKGNRILVESTDSDVQDVSFSISDLSGREIVRTNLTLESGIAEFMAPETLKGIFIASAKGKHGSAFHKIAIK